MKKEKLDRGRNCEIAARPKTKRKRNDSSDNNSDADLEHSVKQKKIAKLKPDEILPQGWKESGELKKNSQLNINCEESEQLPLPSQDLTTSSKLGELKWISDEMYLTVTQGGIESESDRIKAKGRNDSRLKINSDQELRKQAEDNPVQPVRN